MLLKVVCLILLIGTCVFAGRLPRPYSSRRHKVAGHKFDDAVCNAQIETLNPNCGYYVFVTEYSVTTCTYSTVFSALGEYIVKSVIPDGGNSYGIQYFGIGDEWCEYAYNNKQEFEYMLNESTIENGNDCNLYETGAYYSGPFKYLLSLAPSYPNLAVFLQGETDSITDLQNATILAQQVASAIPNLYVYDHSTNGDQTGLFAVLTGNQSGHVIRGDPDLAALKQKVQQQLVPDFLSVACSGSTMPPTKGTTVRTTTKNQITTHRPSTATTGKPSTQVCSLLIFIEEASDVIGYDSKLMFLKLAQQIAMKANKNANQRFAIALYGQEVYQNIEAQNFLDFNYTITNLINVMAEQNLPNGRRTYLQPILSDLDTILYSGFISNFAVLLLAEADKIADPSKASPLFRSAVASGADIYVIDKSKSVNFWAGLPSSHILNGTGATQSSLFANLSKSLVPEFEKMKC